MARIPIHDVTSVPPGSRQALERLSARRGRVLNIHGAMATSPLLLDLYETVETLLARRSSLGEPVRQAIHLTVAAVNDCEYCQAAYTGAARAAGFSLDETLSIRRGYLADREDVSALVALAREIADNRGAVSDDTWAAAIAAGWTVEQVLEAYAEVVRTILTNYFNHLVETDLDLHPAPPLVLTQHS